MRVGFWLVALPLAGFGLWHWTHSGAPNLRQIEPLLRSYLESQHNCSGTLDIKQLDEISVGAYVQQMGGWPVYANHVEVCRAHDLSASYQSTVTTTYDGSHDADNKVAAVFARRTASGGVELFVPEIFQAGQRQMQEQLQKGLDSIKFN
jgi:hypothetical protein